MTKRVVDISIDFDFFVREDPMWDWGHAETFGHGLGSAIWHSRYATVDVHAETDPAAYADCPPWKFVRMLEHAGLSFKSLSCVGIADSHQHAYDFLKPLGVKGRTPPDLVLHFDAHHDCYTDFGGEGPYAPDVSCENWVQHYLGTSRADRTDVVWLRPKWQDGAGTMRVAPESGRLPIRSDWLSLLRGKHGALADMHVRRVFLCLSSAWTPPHLDEHFLLLVRDFTERVHASPNALAHPVFLLDGIPKRTAPTAEEARAAREERAAIFADMLANPRTITPTPESPDVEQPAG